MFRVVAAVKKNGPIAYSVQTGEVPARFNSTRADWALD
jgi:hypothetical protein